MRDNKWLAAELQRIQKEYFPDIPVTNTILVRFGRASKTRFGSIIRREKRNFAQPISLITINALFRDEEVPDYIILTTLMHEFVHYAHGFHSPLKRLYSYPHRGGIVEKEIRKRGGGDLLKLHNIWVKKEYANYYRNRKKL